MSQVDAMLPLAAAKPCGRRRPALATWVAGLVSSLLGGIVLLHAALIPGGRWDGDEYFNFAMLREIGWGFAWRRLYQWSPRPVSEAALWLYDGAVTLAGAPLVAPFLALLWAALIGGGVLALWRPRTPGAPWRLAVALAVPAAMLLVRPINEMFYWPMAAAPYLLALAGIVVLTFRLVAGRTATRRDRTICALALLVAAGSAETGLFFALGCCSALAVADLARRDARRFWYLAPLLASAALLGAWLLFRVADANGGLTADTTYFHHVGPSLLAALRSLPDEFAGTDPLRPGPGVVGTLVADALLFLGMLACFRVALPAPVPRRHLVALAAGIAASAFGTMAGAFYQFGMLCCERHHTFRQALLVVLLVVLARFASLLRAPAVPAAGVVGPLCLLAAAGIALPSRLPGAIGDLRLLPADIAATQQNWAALRDPTRPLVFHLPVHGAVLEGLAWAPGHYTRDGAGPWFVAAVLWYFGRTEGDVVATPPPP